jgi:glutaredoxin-like YruB-family protein
MSVVLYSTPTCGYCRKAKSYLNERKVPFREFDVSRDQRRAEEMIRKSGQMGVPVLDINGRVIVGFNQGAIDQALR